MSSIIRSFSARVPFIFFRLNFPDFFLQIEVDVEKGIWTWGNRSPPTPRCSDFSLWAIQYITEKRATFLSHKGHLFSTLFAIVLDIQS